VPDEVSLLVDGQEYGGWKTARVTVSMEAGSGAFDLSVSERWPGSPAQRAIRPGQRCAVRIGADTRISGYVDEVEVALTDSGHSVQVRGRDAVADLIDCAPDIDFPEEGKPRRAGTVPGQWQNLTLAELVQELAAPFGIPVTVNVPPHPQETFYKRIELVTLNPGQQIYDLIEQQCRSRQVLAISDGSGGLLLTRAGTFRIPTPLVEGENLLSCSATFSAQDRFRDYIVKGQGYDTGTQGEDAGYGYGTAQDADIARHRPLLIVAGKAMDLAQCGERAKWEALTRAARGSRLRLQVQGWRQPNGHIWPVNAIATVRSPTLGVNGEFLVVEVALELPSSVATLSVVRPDAYAPPPASVIEADEMGTEADADADA
jgi:prophage tail gpP-like protein